MDPINEQCFCNLYFVLHDYQKAGDKAKASLDKGLVTMCHRSQSSAYATLLQELDRN